MSPDTIDSAAVEPTLQRIRIERAAYVCWDATRSPSTSRSNLLFHIDQVLPGHSNGMRFTAHDAALEVLAREEYYSIGGGFIVQAGAPTVGRREARAAAVRVRFRGAAARACAGRKAWRSTS